MINDEKVVCLDLGNTNCHVGLFHGKKCVFSNKTVTSSFIENPRSFLSPFCEGSNFSYCSVVPKAEKALRSVISPEKLFLLKDLTSLKIPISYPTPNEIGTDRLANVIATYTKSILPAIIIDIGTATTFDIVTKSGGYEGGVIAPGPQGYLDFLQQNTALLPKISLQSELSPSSVIGKSTTDAMLLGVKLGFDPMVIGILENLIHELKVLEEEKIKVLVVGGAVGQLDSHNFLQCPLLTLEGLAMAYLKP